MSVSSCLHAIKSILAYVFSLIAFPLSCISCGNQSYGIPLCSACKSELLHDYEQKESRCKVCGVLLVSEKETCLDCRKTAPKSEKCDTNMLVKKYTFLKDFDSIFPIHQYVLWKKELLFAWKMANNRSLTPLFARLVHDVLKTYYSSIPLVPVPPRKGKVKERGWDQIEDLCTCLHHLYGYTAQKLLVRISKEEQKKRSRKERLEDLEKNYVFSHKIQFVPSEVVIIDDIMTTGATLESCAKALKEAGVEHIHAVTLFYV